MIDRHITISEEHDKILKSIVDNVVGVNNKSEAIRYLCIQYDPETQRSRDSKLNAMSKEISILLTILTSSLAESVDVTELDNYYSNLLYLEAKSIVEEKIQNNITRKKIKNMPF